MTLPPLVAVILLVVLAGAPGVLIQQLWGRRLADDGVEYTFGSITLGVLLLGWSALVLAELDLFSLFALAIVWVAAMGILLVAWLLRRRRMTANTAPRPGWSRLEWVGLALWLIVASVVYFRPHEFVIGGADAGVYVNLGANIAKTGGILVHDPLLGQLDPELRPALLRAMPEGEAAPFYILPGFYVTGSPNDLITPQFFHLHPIWQAIGYTLGGLPVELLITPLWGLLGCLAVYMTVRALWGWKAAMLALIALSATALQIWFARYPTAEVLTQYLFWTGAWALTQWLGQRKPAGLWAALAGLAFGQVFLTRLDTYVLLALPVLLAIWFAVTRSWRRDALWFFVPLLLLALHSVTHGLLVTRPYFSFITRIGVNALIRGMLPLAGVVLPIGIITTIWLRTRPSWRTRTEHAVTQVAPVALRLCAILVIALALFAYFIRPQLVDVRPTGYWYGGGELPKLDQESFVRLGWYLSPFGLILSIAGIAWLLLHEANRKTAFLIVAGGFFSVIFLWRIGANPHQIYAMRRYVPQVLPFFIVATVYLLHWLYGNLSARRRWLAAVLTVAWLTGILWSARPFVEQVDYRGLAEQIERLDAALPRKAVVLFNDPAPVGLGDLLGTPLRFLHDRPVFVLRQSEVDPLKLAEAFDNWRNQGYEVVLLSTDETHPWPLPIETLGAPEDHLLKFSYLENTYDTKPYRILPVEWHVAVRPVEILRGSQ